MIDFITKNGYEGVTAYDESIIGHFAVGEKNGVVKGVFNEFDCDPSDVWTSSKIEIQSGCGIVYGRQFYIRNGTTEEVALTLPSSGSYYYIIYAKMDCVNSLDSTVTIEATYGTSDYPEFPASNNLLEIKNGIAYLPLYKLKLTASGNGTELISVIDLLWAKSGYVKLFDGVGLGKRSVDMANDILAGYRTGEKNDWRNEFRYLEFEVARPSDTIRSLTGRIFLPRSKPVGKWRCICADSYFSGNNFYYLISRMEYVESVDAFFINSPDAADNYEGYIRVINLATGETSGYESYERGDLEIKSIYGIY